MGNNPTSVDVRLGFDNRAGLGFFVDVKNGFYLGHENSPMLNLYYHTSCLMNSCWGAAGKGVVPVLLQERHSFSNRAGLVAVYLTVC
jgi:hypothetical protein